MRRLILILTLVVCSVQAIKAQTYAYRFVKAVNSNTGELISNYYAEEIVYITFCSGKAVCYKSDANVNRIKSTASKMTNNNDVYSKLASRNGIVTYKCTFKIYEQKSAIAFDRVETGEGYMYLHFSTDYNRLNIINDTSYTSYANPLIPTNTPPLKLGGDKTRTLVYEKIKDLSGEVMPDKLW